MANITKGKTFISGETVEPSDLHQLVDSATIAFVTADDTDDSTLEASGGKLRAKDAGITAAKLADGAVTGAAGGGKVAASAITGQTQLADPLAAGDEFLVHDTSASALRRVAWSAMQPAGTVVQTAYDQLVGAQSYTVGQTLGVAVTPTITSGVEILASNNISVSDSSNYVLIQVAAQLATSAATSTILMLFADNTLLATSSTRGSNETLQQKIIYKHAPGSTSPVNYTVRAASESGTLYVNRLYTVLDYNTGYQVSSMMLQEIKA